MVIFLSCGRIAIVRVGISGPKGARNAVFYSRDSFPICIRNKVLSCLVIIIGANDKHGLVIGALDGNRYIAAVLQHTVGHAEIEGKMYFFPLGHAVDKVILRKIKLPGPSIAPLVLREGDAAVRICLVIVAA